MIILEKSSAISYKWCGSIDQAFIPSREGLTKEIKWRVVKELCLKVFISETN